MVSKPSHPTNRGSRLVSCAALVALPWSGLAANYTWTPSASGGANWNDSRNWLGGPSFAQAKDDVASFTRGSMGNGVVEVRGKSIALGKLNLSGSSGSGYMFQSTGVLGGQSLTLAASGTAQVTLDSRNRLDHHLNLGVVLASDTKVTVDGTGTLCLDGTVSGGGRLTKAGNGTLRLTGANTFSGMVNLMAGSLILENPQALGSAAGVQLNGGTLVLQAAALAVQAPLSFGGGTLQLGSGTGVDSAGARVSLEAVEGTSRIVLTPDGTKSTLRLSLGLAGLKPGGQLTIENWTGTAGASGREDRIFVEGPALAMSSSFGYIRFNLGAQGMRDAIVLRGAAGDELVPVAVPEPHAAALAVGTLLLGFGTWRRARHS